MFSFFFMFVTFPNNYFEMKHLSDHLGSEPSLRLIPDLWINLKSDGMKRKAVFFPQDGSCRQHIKKMTRRFVFCDHAARSSNPKLLKSGYESGRGATLPAWINNLDISAANEKALVCLLRIKKANQVSQDCRDGH